LPKGDIAEDRPKISLFRKAGRMAQEPVAINCERYKQHILNYTKGVNLMVHAFLAALFN